MGGARARLSFVALAAVLALIALACCAVSMERHAVERLTLLAWCGDPALAGQGALFGHCAYCWAAVAAGLAAIASFLQAGRALNKNAPPPRIGAGEFGKAL